MNEIARFLAFAGTIFPAIIAVLVLMSHLESNLDRSDADDHTNG